MSAKRLLLLSLIVAAGCKSPTPAEQVDTIMSWIGTATMAAEAWLRHTTPDAYTRQTLELAARTLGQTSKDLLESPPPNRDTAALDSALTRARERIARMALLITAKDAPDFGRQLDSLRADQKILKQFSNSIETKQ